MSCNPEIKCWPSNVSKLQPGVTVIGDFIIFSVMLIASSIVVAVITTRIHLKVGHSKPPQTVVALLNCCMMDLLFLGKLDKATPVVQKNQVGSEMHRAEVTKENEGPSEESERELRVWSLLSELINRVMLVVYVGVLSVGALVYGLELHSLAESKKEAVKQF